MKINPNRICLECKHCWVGTGSCGYSEYTPSTEFHFGCMKSRGFGGAFNALKEHEGSKSSMIEDLRIAETCKDFILETK